jgi:hypothetical protein
MIMFFWTWVDICSELLVTTQSQSLRVWMSGLGQTKRAMESEPDDTPEPKAPKVRLPIVVQELNGKEHKMDVDPNETVADVKQRVAELVGNVRNVGATKLIVLGRILKDAQTMGSCNLRSRPN